MIDRNKYFTLTIFAECNLEDMETVPKTEGFMLSVPKRMPEGAFFKNGGIPNENGNQLITSMLVEALAGNIHAAHQKGTKDSAEHLREVTSRLEDLFVAITTVQVGFEDKMGWLGKYKK